MEISVIIPTYAPGKYIEDCLLSLEKQTLNKTKYEVLIILNGEKDPYFEYLNQLLRKFSFAKEILFTPQKGVSNARNLGLKASSGDNICFIDDDDVISSNYLEELLKDVYPDEIVVSNVLTFKNDIQDTSTDYLSEAYKNKCSETSKFSNRKFFSSAWAKIIPRQVLKDRYFDCSISLGEDSLFMADISNRIRRIKKAKEDVIYYRRIREASASRKKYSKSVNSATKRLLLKKYILVYLKGICNYSPLFFFSRIIATLKR